MTTVKTHLHAAESFARYGLRVFPLAPGTKIPPKGFAGSVNNATTDLELVREWWEPEPESNIGLTCGDQPAGFGLLVVDVDVKDGKRGDLELKQLEEQYGRLPRTVRTETPSGGNHRFLRYSLGLDVRGGSDRLAPGVDVRAKGQYVVVPTSRTPGGVYRFHDRFTLDAIAPAPKWMLARLVKTEHGRTNGHRDISGIDTVREVLSYVPTRPDYDTWIIVITAVLDSLGGDVEAAETLLKEWSPEEEPGEYRYKLAHPLDRIGFDRLVNMARENGYQQSVSREDVIECYKLDERGDAKLYAKASHDLKRFVFYDAGIWQEDETLQARREIPQRCRGAYLRASRQLDKEITALVKDDGAPDEIKDKEGLRDGLRKRADQLNRLSRIKHVAELAASEMPALTNDFDRDRRLFAVFNGTYDLRADVFREHDPKDRITKRAPILYDADARCPEFIAFLNKICAGSDPLIKYLQIICGYTLTGLTDLDLLFFFYGSGANGKSTFIAALEMLLGDYFRSLPIETLLTKRYNATDEYHIAKLHGVRLCVASEIPQGRRLNESLVKDLTGGDQLTGRVPYGEPFNFQPSHKLIIVGNHKPVIKGTDEGIWRRIRLIPFAVRIPESEQKDRSDLLAHFRRELPGILNWAIEGYRLYQDEGLDAPKAVDEATTAFRSESDVLGGFLAENCLVADNAKLVAKPLYVYYAGWCEQTNEQPLKYKDFNTALRERGFTVEPGTGNRTEVFGLGLLEDRDDDS